MSIWLRLFEIKGCEVKKLSIVDIVSSYNHTWLFLLQTQNTVYEIVSDMSSRQDALEDRLTTVEDKLSTLQEQLDMLPDLIASRIAVQVNII